MVFQQPNPFPMSIFDNVAYALREQGIAAAAQGGARAAGDRGARARRPARRGPGQPRPPGAAPLRRPAAAAVHRPRARRATPRCCCSTSRARRSTRSSTQTIEELIVRLREEVAIVIVTHNLQQAHRVADHVAFMYLGRPRRVRRRRRRSSARRARSARASTSRGRSDEPRRARRSCSRSPALVLLGAAGCESTQDKSARLAQGVGRHRAGAGRHGRRGPTATSRSLDTAVITDENGTAVVVRMRNDSARALADVPVTIDVLDARRQDRLHEHDARARALADPRDGHPAPRARPSGSTTRCSRPRRRAKVDAKVGAAEGQAPPDAAAIRVGRVDADRGPGQRPRRHRHRHEPRRRRTSGASCSPPSRARATRSSPPAAGSSPRVRAGKRARFRIFFIGDPKGAELTVTATPSPAG